MSNNNESQFKLGDRIQFDLEVNGKPSPQSPFGQGTVTRATHGMTLIAPDKPFPNGARMTNIRLANKA